MKKESIMIGVIGLLVGVVLTGFTAGQAVNNNNSGMMRMMGMDTSKNEKSVATDHGTMSMADMNKQLEGLSGDDFDKAFIEMMIAHHEGAVSMAELVPSRAKHDEVKKLGEAVIAAQTKEIADMKQWQKDWGYSSNEMMDMMHGSN
ncbi:DUF305 domain-containing protein [Candidatus Saccharibacteria bacterium]|nr:DUF305 domain-containing protein [Candidatus Saccharibacteria bacterium]